MKRLLLTPAARDDLRSIWLYTAERWGIDKADDYTDALEAACLAVAAGRASAVTAAARRDYRRRVVRSHVIYFTVQPDQVTVIRILHSRQDPALNLDE